MSALNIHCVNIDRIFVGRRSLLKHSVKTRDIVRSACNYGPRTREQGIRTEHEIVLHVHTHAHAHESSVANDVTKISSTESILVSFCSWFYVVCGSIAVRACVSNC